MPVSGYAENLGRTCLARGVAKNGADSLPKLSRLVHGEVGAGKGTHFCPVLRVNIAYRAVGPFDTMTG